MLLLPLLITHIRNVTSLPLFGRAWGCCYWSWIQNTTYAVREAHCLFEDKDFVQMCLCVSCLSSLRKTTGLTPWITCWVTAYRSMPDSPDSSPVDPCLAQSDITKTGLGVIQSVIKMHSRSRFHYKGLVSEAVDLSL